MKIFWMVLAGVGIVVAGFFLLRRDLEAAFVVAALAMVAWLLNHRAQLKESLAAADLNDKNKRDEENGENWNDN